MSFPLRMEPQGWRGNPNQILEDPVLGFQNANISPMSFDRGGGGGMNWGAIGGMAAGGLGLLGLAAGMFDEREEYKTGDFINEEWNNSLFKFGGQLMDPTSGFNKQLLRQNQEMLADRGGVAARIQTMKGMGMQKVPMGIAWSQQKQMDFDAGKRAFENWQKQLFQNTMFGAEVQGGAVQRDAQARSFAQQMQAEEEASRDSFWDSLTGALPIAAMLL